VVTKAERLSPLLVRVGPSSLHMCAQSYIPNPYSFKQSRKKRIKDVMFTVERAIQGKKITIETGRIAKQASGSVVVRCGESMVLVTACVGPDKGGDFLPLTIDYIEKNYAAGKIPGGFYKREGKLSEKEILTSRLIDRPCRPLFPEGFSYEVQVIATVLSADEQNDTDVLGVIGASAALSLSELPFEGPMAAVRVARIGGKLEINPDNSRLDEADLMMIVAGTHDAIVMVEGGAQEVPEAEVLEAIFFAHREMQPIIEMQLELKESAGRPTMEFVAPNPEAVVADIASEFKTFVRPLIASAVQESNKLTRRDLIKQVKTTALEKFSSGEGTEVIEKRDQSLDVLFSNEVYEAVRDLAFDKGVRIDGRDFNTVRPISIEVGFLPRTHGSALFTRGETQAIVVVTLGTEAEAQRLDNLIGDTTKSFLLHYNFPPFSVGETKPVRGPGRREIGHGALAERAVKAVLPSSKEFPYVVRIVSEITESNGSSSMATVCGSSLALMQAGVPIKSPVAGVAMGLMKKEDKFVVLTDILGDEDHLGDMDFKVCGTNAGITAIQMDIKIKGLDKQIMDKALSQAREARLHIIEKMNEAISSACDSLSRYAPRIVSFKIPVDKIRDIIGPGGKKIRSITESCNVKIEVGDDGTVSIASSDEGRLKEARDIIESLTAEAEIGKIYRGVVKRVTDFGAFVEIISGTDGLVHISQFSDERVRKVTDVVDEGDEIWVKVLDIDRQGKIRLSMKEALSDMKEQGLLD
jgi:polyribonucleotide nucleotidyltransferase